MKDALSLPARPDERRGWLAPLNPPLADWRGRTAWIVGASSGIGLALAQALHARGANVVVSARNQSALEAFASEHPGSRSIALDVRDAQSLREAATGISDLAPIDAVIYCAGHYRAQRATAFDLADMQRHLDINYTGALHVLDAVLPGMLARGQGHISLISSVAGFRGLPQSLAYGPTKAALINLAETLYIDLCDRGIGVSLVNPGFVETPLTAQNQFAMPALISPAQAAERILEGWRQGRFEIHFPRRFTWWMKALQLLPFRCHQALVRRFTGL